MLQRLRILVVCAKVSGVREAYWKNCTLVKNLSIIFLHRVSYGKLMCDVHPQATESIDSVTSPNSLLIDPDNALPGRQGFDFALWNATIFSGLMQLCAMQVQAAPTLLYGAASGWTDEEGTTLYAWDIGLGKEKHSGTSVWQQIASLLMLYCAWLF